MKISVLLTLIFGASSSLHAAATMYQALEHFADERGSDALDSVMLIRGEGGQPQPAEWIVYRGGAKDSEFRAEGITSSGRVLSGKASARELNLPPHAERVNFSMLSVDSNAAFRIATQEARKENFSFDRIDYELRANSLAGVPAWSLRLFNESKSYLGELTLSAATGEILRPLQLHSYAVKDVGGQEKLVMVREPWARRAVRSVGRWFSQTGTTFGKDTLRGLGTAEEIAIGNRTRDDAFKTD